MAYHIQYRATRTSWKTSGFARSFPTADEAWKYCATLDQDGFIPPDARVVDSTGHVCERPAASKYQAEIFGL